MMWLTEGRHIMTSATAGVGVFVGLALLVAAGTLVEQYLSSLQDQLDDMRIDFIRSHQRKTANALGVPASKAGSADKMWLQVAQRVGSPTSGKITDHAYNRIYDHFLSPIRHNDLKMLEIGLGCDINYGLDASAKIWDSFLTPNSEIGEPEVDANCV